MSKSMGNVIAPQKVSDTMGADILRLWVASTDYSGELSISDTILKRVVESYRRLRNTLCFLLGNLNDFDPARDALPIDELLEMDRYALALAAQMQQDTLADYEKYSFHPVVARLVSFCSEDLGAFYLDALKDRLYTTASGSRARRSAQTVLWHITEAMCRLMAPILSFTANEAWQSLSESTAAQPPQSLFEKTAHPFPQVADATNLIAKWDAIRQVRAQVLKAIELEREAGRVGSSLQAGVRLTAGAGAAPALQSLGDALKFVLITSAAQVRLDSTLPTDQVDIQVEALEYAKCGRCWHLRPEVGQNDQHPDLCDRCISNLFGAGEERGIA
jgi:isoleucyl-tRNA synthetase